jgi:predicted DNA-binding transcriptional regulator YafY
VEVLVIGNEMTERLINLLQPDLQSVVRMRFDGWTIAQMATALGVSPRSIDRMLDSIRRIRLSSDLLRGVRGLERFRDEQP